MGLRVSVKGREHAVFGRHASATHASWQRGFGKALIKWVKGSSEVKTRSMGWFSKRKKRTGRRTFGPSSSKEKEIGKGGWFTIVGLWVAVGKMALTIRLFVRSRIIPRARGK